MIKDKKMEMMMFATLRQAISTVKLATASKYVEDREHTERMRSETGDEPCQVLAGKISGAQSTIISIILS